MKKYFQIYAAVLVFGFIISCNNQNKTSQPKVVVSEPKQPEVNLPETDPFPIKSNKTNPSYGPNSITRNIIQDKKGNIWLASWEGIIRYNGSSFTNITSEVSLSRFFSVLEDWKGNFWFASIGDGVYYYDGNSFKNFTTKDGLANNRVTTIYEDKKGHIWFGTEGGASMYNGTSLKNFTTKDGLPYNNVNTIIEDKSGNFWFGTGGDTCLFDGKTFTKVTNKDGTTFKNVRSIIEDKKGAIWLGGNDGLWRYKDNKFTQFTKEFVGYVYEDKNGNIWTSSESSDPRGWALSRYNKATLNNEKVTATRILTKEGMFFGILEDTDGGIWLGTLNGVYHYDGHTFNDFKSNIIKK